MSTTETKKAVALFTGSQLHIEDSRVLAYIANQAVISGLFTKLTNDSEAIMKITMGREFGLSLYESLSDLNYVDGRIEMSSVLMAKLLRRNGRYDYRIRETNNTIASIEFFEIHGSEKESLGTSTFTLEDAKQAGLLRKDNWQKYPRAMLLWRAMSQGISFYCPDAIEGGRVYVQGEISDGPPLNPVPTIRNVTVVDASPVGGEPQTIEQEPPAQTTDTPAAAAEKTDAKGTVTQIESKRRRSQTAKDTDKVLDVQIEAWHRAHHEHSIPAEWDSEHLSALGVASFEDLKVGPARRLLLELNDLVRKMKRSA